MRTSLIIARALAISVALSFAIEASVAGAAGLPRNHPYQQQLRNFMATLMEADFQPEHKVLTVVPVAGDADEQFRAWILSLSPPAVGRKRNHSSVMIKPALFTLATIEGPMAVMRPPAHSESLVDLANWKYAGNPYFDSRPLRLRAFVLAALDIIMLDNLLGGPTDAPKPNQDHLAGGIERLAYVYPGFSALLPNEVREAYLTGLKKLVRRALDHGPKVLTGRTQAMYTRPTYALGLAAKVLNDPAIANEVEAYARTVFTTEPFFRKAGYFPHGGTLDSFNGISTCFAISAALANDWPFARDAVGKIYRLRAHLTLPEPDGVLVGPSHMAALTSAEPVRDQWNGRARDWAAAMISDEAACMTKKPDAAEIQRGRAAAVGEINAQLQELSWAPGGLEPAPWTFQPPGIPNNPAYQYYPRGYVARRGALDQKNDLVRLPVLREGNFVRTFGDELLVAKTGTHAAIIHTGPIADLSEAEPAYGFGGGALSAFWTRATGSVILGRGTGSWAPQYKQQLDEWRSLPTHAVTGITSDGRIYTSAHIVQPEKSIDARPTSYSIRASGRLPTFRQMGDKPSLGRIAYVREFTSTDSGVQIVTTLRPDGKEQFAELYEVLPVFLRDLDHQRDVKSTTIELQVAGKWTPAADAPTAGVAAIRLARFGGAVQIIFDKPRRVKLAPAWHDAYMTHVSCRNLLIDLLDDGAGPLPADKERTVAYRIEAEAK